MRCRHAGRRARRHTRGDSSDAAVGRRPPPARARRLRRIERAGGPGGPVRPPTGIVPLARLVGLIALAIAIVVGFVFWVGACQGKSKHDQYAAYAQKVRSLAASSTAL